MSSTSHLNIEDIPKKYLMPLPKEPGEGSRVNGKDYKIKKDAFRVKSLGVRKLSTWETRQKERMAQAQFKAKYKELKEEKANARQARIDEIKRRREAKEEKERYERMAATMHAKKVERKRRKEKRNKVLKER
ncbi:hypothetical protein DIURU_000695 [Diutina rugosa]|uniref:rRNA-processing protein n=1 Tax=Diutina rugosa TaxID=5481 RepID=A0A642UWY5_DIURU|nr:uncharacterized protein DIURU_000695 [Diutina rugosa]KAA8907011.1 hypothetical protein DIURU_000695 [Diutina rugosa]